MRTGTVIAMAVQQMVCTACGSEANASCNCGKPYLPKKQRAAEAIAANPQRSNRAIASEIGVDEGTVRAARTAEHSAVEREGLDGKVRRLPVRVAEPDEDDIEADITPRNRRAAFLIRADQARQFAAYSGPVDREIREAARVVIDAWQELISKLNQKEPT